MKTLMTSKRSAIALAFMTATLLTACNKDAAKTESATAAKTEMELNTSEQKVTYIVGYRVASQAKQGGFSIDADAMNLAVQDVLEGKDPRIPQDQQHEIMMEFQKEAEAKRQAELSKAGEENKAKGEAFLAENAKKEGVKVTESGLQYKVITAVKDGVDKPTSKDRVKVHYHGTLIDGTVFDSSKDRGQPMTFPLGGVIPGWIEGLQLMKEGEKFELYIPHDLAYGERGSGAIGPNSALVFEVELLAINPEPEATDPHAGHGHGADPHAGHGHGADPHAGHGHGADPHSKKAEKPKSPH